MDYTTTIFKRRRHHKVEYLARLRYCDAETGARKEKSKSAPTISEAKRRLRELEEEFEIGGQTAVESDLLTFADLVKHFGLELAVEKTRVIPFSRYRRGETSFDFLGFEFRWGTDRKGQARLQRRTSRKKFRNSVKRVAEWCKKNRHRRVGEQFKRLNAKLRGYYNYYGVRGNYASLNEFFQQVQRLHLKWLNRRSQRQSYTWAGYRELIQCFALARPRIVGRPNSCLTVSR